MGPEVGLRELERVCAALTGALGAPVIAPACQGGPPKPVRNGRVRRLHVCTPAELAAWARPRRRCPVISPVPSVRSQNNVLRTCARGERGAGRTCTPGCVSCMNSNSLLTTVFKNFQWLRRKRGYCPTTYLHGPERAKRAGWAQAPWEPCTVSLAKSRAAWPAGPCAGPPSPAESARCPAALETNGRRAAAWGVGGAGGAGCGGNSKDGAGTPGRHWQSRPIERSRQCFRFLTDF